MTPDTSVQPSWKIVPSNSDLRNQVLSDTLRAKTTQICECRQAALDLLPTPEKAAEGETLRPLDCGMLLFDEKIELTTDAGCFEEGDVRFCAEPHRLTLWGNCSGAKMGASPVQNSSHGLIFRYVNLAYEIEPAKVTIERNGRILTINLPRRLASQP